MYSHPAMDFTRARMVRLKGTKAGDQLVFQRPQTVKGAMIETGVWAGYKRLEQGGALLL